MSAIPPAAWPFLFAVLALVAARVLVGQVKDDALPGGILYAVAVGCVLIGLAVLWLDRFR